MPELFPFQEFHSATGLGVFSGILSRNPRIHSLESSENAMIRKLKSGEYRLYSRKKDADTGKRKNLGTFGTMEKAKAHERAVQYFKRAG
jgi:hypothetical protein